MAVYSHLIWLLCAIIVITKVHGKSISMKSPLYIIEDQPDVGVDSSRVKRAAFFNNRWNETTVTYTLTNEPHAMPWHQEESMTYTRTRQLVANAFAMWAPHCGLNFHELKPSQGGRADITLTFYILAKKIQNKIIADGPGNMIAYARHDTTKNTYEVVFDDSENWVDRNVNSTEASTGRVSFLSTALHEIGHALGLKHNSSENSIMHPSKSGVFSLDATDITNMRNIYGINNNTTASPVAST